MSSNSNKDKLSHHKLEQLLVNLSSMLDEQVHSESQDFSEDQIQTRLDFMELLMEHWSSPVLLYAPSSNLIKRIQDYKDWLEGKRDEDAGQLLEEIAYLCFKSIKGLKPKDIESFTSYNAQHDLVVASSSELWKKVLDYLDLPPIGKTFIVESKNQKDKLSSQQFSRLCYLVQNKFDSNCNLGIFFARKVRPDLIQLGY